MYMYVYININMYVYNYISMMCVCRCVGVYAQQLNFGYQIATHLIPFWCN